MNEIELDLDKTFVVIQGRMIKDLKLRGDELIIFAIIYGFSQKGNGIFYGTYLYLSLYTGKGRKAIGNILASLVDKGYILKVEEVIGWQQRVCYKYNNELNKTIGVKNERVNANEKGEINNNNGGDCIDKGKKEKRKGKEIEIERCNSSASTKPYAVGGGVLEYSYTLPEEIRKAYINKIGENKNKYRKEWLEYLSKRSIEELKELDLDYEDFLYIKDEMGIQLSLFSYEQKAKCINGYPRYFGFFRDKYPKKREKEKTYKAYIEDIAPYEGIINQFISGAKEYSQYCIDNNIPYMQRKRPLTFIKEKLYTNKYM